jgi:broad specificity phosphatase PhoE
MPPCPAPNTWLYLLRHGATLNNEAVPPRIQGCRSDPPLCEAGREQARRAAGFLAGMRIDAVYASPLLRARQTAEAIAAAHELPVDTVAGLTEIDCGQWEGLTWAEVEHRDPAAFQAFAADPVNQPYLGGEDLHSMQQRVVPVIERLMADHAGRSIAVVAHNMVNRCYLAHLLHVPLPRYRSITQDNGGINVLRSTDGHVRAVTINSVWHLDVGVRSCPRSS